MAKEEKGKAKAKAPAKEMPFLEHLDELRGVILQSLLVVAVLAVGAWLIAEEAVEILTAPADEGLIFLSPTEAFTLRLKVSLLLGFFIGLPFVLTKVWGFVAPGLFRREKKVLGGVVIGSTILFLTGAVFAFFILVPFALKFLLGFGTENLRPMISASNYFGFVIKLVIAFGIVFQLPLVVAVLTWAGLLDPRWLFRQWRLALLVIISAAAFLTPPDVASQMLMALPVTLLYFLSAFLSLFIHRGRKKRLAEEKRAGQEEDEPETDGERTE